MLRARAADGAAQTAASLKGQGHHPEEHPVAVKTGRIEQHQTIVINQHAKNPNKAKRSININNQTTNINIKVVNELLH